MPQSLFGRFLMIILLPNIIIQCFAVYMFYARHWEGVSRHMMYALAGDVSFVVESVENLEEERREAFVKRVSSLLYMDVSFFKDVKMLNKHTDDDFYDLAQVIEGKITYPTVIYYDDSMSNMVIDVQLDQGILHIMASKKRVINPSTYIFVMWMIGSAFIFLLISVLFMRNQVRSITDLASAAEQFGLGKDNAKFKPTGAEEVRQVGKAFIDMKERIKKQIEQRTEMLAGVSHDLRTPLTRIKLQLSMMEQSKDIIEIKEDIIEMEKMIQGYLDFAKGKERVIDASVNVSDLLRSIVSGYRNHHKNIELKAKSGVIIHVNSNAIRRLIANILDNALRYGNKVCVQMNCSQKNVIINIDDDGPGIAPKKREDAFKPFNRLDNSRHIESGNTGLGLSIAKDIAVGYGGDIRLEDSPLGGLRVAIIIPL